MAIMTIVIAIMTIVIAIGFLMVAINVNYGNYYNYGHNGHFFVMIGKIRAVHTVRREHRHQSTILQVRWWQV